jgi:hypothetical protein
MGKWDYIMATTPEGRIKAKVKALFHRYNVWYFMPANNGYGRSGVPDFVACANGRFIGVETKADGTKKATALQELCGQAIISSGAYYAVVFDDFTLLSLEIYLKVGLGMVDVSSRGRKGTGTEAE